MQHRAGRGSLLGIKQTDGECEREEGREIGEKQLAAAIRVPSHVVRNVTDLSISFKDEKEEKRGEHSFLHLEESPIIVVKKHCPGTNDGPSCSSEETRSERAHLLNEEEKE